MRTFIMSVICLIGLVAAAQSAEPFAAQLESTPTEKPIEDPGTDPAEAPGDAPATEPIVEPAEEPAASVGDRIEVRMVGTLEAGVVAIGGETTGFTITSGGFTWEVDFSQRPRLAKRASTMGNSKVILEGTLERREGVETGQRDVVVAVALRPAVKPTALNDQQRQLLRNKLLEQKRQATKSTKSRSLPALKRTLDSQSEPPRPTSPFEN